MCKRGMSLRATTSRGALNERIIFALAPLWSSASAAARADVSRAECDATSRDRAAASSGRAAFLGQAVKEQAERPSGHQRLASTRPAVSTAVIAWAASLDCRDACGAVPPLSFNRRQTRQTGCYRSPSRGRLCRHPIPPPRNRLQRAKGRLRNGSKAIDTAGELRDNAP